MKRKKAEPTIPLKAEPIPDYTTPRNVLRSFADRLAELSRELEEDNLQLKIESEYLETSIHTMTKQPGILVNLVDIEQEKSVFSALRPTVRFEAQGAEKILISATLENDIPDKYETIVLKLNAPEPESLQFLEETLEDLFETTLS
jgi:hypothetical protein